MRSILCTRHLIKLFLSYSTTTGAALFGVDTNKVTSSGRPVSPVMPWKSPEMNQSFEQAYNKQQGQPSQETQAVSTMLHLCVLLYTIYLIRSYSSRILMHKYLLLTKLESFHNAR